MHAFPDEQEQAIATRIFWSLYTLDRRASLGTGTPFIIQDSDIDPNLPEPVSIYILLIRQSALYLQALQDAANPYLCQVVSYARLSGKAWNVTNGFGSSMTDLKLDEIICVDFQLSQWQKRIPESLSYNPLNPTGSSETPGQVSTYVRAILYART